MHGVSSILTAMAPPFFKKYGNISTVTGILNACALIKEGAKSEEIAVVLGYSTVFNFSRAFKKQFGLSPNAYRKQLKQ